MQSRPSHSLTEAARRLRRRQTRSEELFWEVVRARRFRGLKFRRQHASDGTVIDFYCHALQLAVEIDGSVHDAPAARLHDANRAAVLERAGHRLVRIPAGEVIADAQAAADRYLTPFIR